MSLVLNMFYHFNITLFNDYIILKNVFIFQKYHIRKYKSLYVNIHNYKLFVCVCVCVHNAQLPQQSINTHNTVTKLKHLLVITLCHITVRQPQNR